MAIRMQAGLMCLLFALVFLSPSSADPDPDPDPNAEIVFVREDCGPQGSEMENCFESMLALSEYSESECPEEYPFPADRSPGWIWTTRKPDAANPLVVDIGPGRFGEFRCPNTQCDEDDEKTGHVTVRGAGRGITILDGLDEPPGGTSGISVMNCTNLAFSDLTATGPIYGIRWGGGGDATWTNVDMETYNPPATTAGASAGWIDQCDFGAPDSPPNPPMPASLVGERSVHFYFGSRSRAFGGTGSLSGNSFVSLCAENWFYGGDIELAFDDPSAKTPGSGNFGAAVLLLDNGMLQAFGTSIRVRSSVETTPGLPLKAVSVVSGAPWPINFQPMFHLHGGIISVEAGAGDTDVIGINLSDDGQQPPGTHSFAHTPGSAFALAPSGSGTATRLVATGSSVVQSPLLWPASDEPPASANGDLASLDGQDLYVENDCSTAGDCSGAGDESHLMAYDADCTTDGPWRDVMTGRCRGVTQ